MTTVKICGITRLEDAELAVELGAWALGLHPLAAVQAPRRSRAWPRGDRPRAAPQGRARRRVRQPAAGRDRRRCVDTLGLTHVQLHGDEGPSFCAAVAQRTGAKVIKAVRIAPRRPTCASSSASTPTSTCSTRAAGACYGGTGQTWDWSLVAQPAHEDPVPARRRADAGQRRRRRSPPSSRGASTWPRGVESAPGVKDPAKLEAFFAAVDGVLAA